MSWESRKIREAKLEFEQKIIINPELKLAQEIITILNEFNKPGYISELTIPMEAISEIAKDNYYRIHIIAEDFILACWGGNLELPDTVKKCIADSKKIILEYEIIF